MREPASPNRRAAGVLLHPTSLPGRFGIGTLGAEVFRFLDFLANAGLSVWEILPLSPTGYGDSPYASFSAFAGNPLLIDLETASAEQGFPLEGEETPVFPEESVDFGRLIPWKTTLLARMANHFKANSPQPLVEGFERFRRENESWLDDYALFRALQEAHGGAPWNTWETELKTRRPEALQSWRERLAKAVFVHQYQQFLFFHQWDAVRAAARDRGVTLLGDLPIFVAYDSSDVWVHPQLFDLDEELCPRSEAGVPPDYFSPTGQLWGNPLFRWDQMAEDGYAWWITRIRQGLRTVDRIRLDHFRGFEAYWAVPGGNLTAEQGEWRKGPGSTFFKALQVAFGDPLPLVAEDLGFITPEVEALRKQFVLPGMKILQFAFSTDARNGFLPHNFDANEVVYTGTHDNDTTVGYFRKASSQERDFALHYTPSDGVAIEWDLIRLAYQSVANLSVIPLQDILGLDSSARMNTPGTSSGNWSWRYRPGALGTRHANHLHDLAETYGRIEPSHPRPKPTWM